MSFERPFTILCFTVLPMSFVSDPELFIDHVFNDSSFGKEFSKKRGLSLKEVWNQIIPPQFFFRVWF